MVMHDNNSNETHSFESERSFWFLLPFLTVAAVAMAFSLPNNLMQSPQNVLHFMKQSESIAKIQRFTMKVYILFMEIYSVETDSMEISTHLPNNKHITFSCPFLCIPLANDSIRSSVYIWLAQLNL